MLPLALAHERLFVGRPVQPLHRQHAFTVPTVLVVGFAVFAFEQLHIPLRARDWCEILPARLAYISMVGDRDNNDDEIPPWRCMAAPGERRTTAPVLIYSMNSMICDQLMPALASSTATRSSISASTESSFSSPEPSLKSVARDFSRNSVP